MKIKFTGKHKSLRSFESEELPELTVIIGKNGSGKSQLIELFQQHKDLINTIGEKSGLELDPVFSRIQIEGHTHTIITSFGPNFQAAEINNIWERLLRDMGYFLEILDIAEEFSIPVQHGFISKIASALPYDRHRSFQTKIANVLKNFPHSKSLTYKSLEQLLEQQLEQQQLPQLLLHQIEIYQNSIDDYFFEDVFPVAKFVREYRKKEYKSLLEVDFRRTPIPSQLIGDKFLFSMGSINSFYSYIRRRYLNARDFFEKNSLGKPNGSVSDSEFAQTESAPWEIVNNLFSLSKLDYHFTGLDIIDFEPEVSAEFQLIKSSTNEHVRFENLSSGEKIIISLILSVFSASCHGEKLSYPELLILDEPDAHLHPEMSKLLIDVLEKTFSKGLGMKVLFTTHSPSTVALCPEDSIFEIKNGLDTSIRRIEKSEALRLLTGHLPMLSIDYKNHKQVFVESPTDVYYFQTIFNKLHEENTYPFKLYFISNAMGKGNCDQVKDIVSDLRKSGNQTSFGIIDWDLTNKTTSHVYVHGEESRYSIENFVYDPIYICILLLAKKDQKCLEGLNVDSTFLEYSITNTNISLAPKCIEWFFKIYSRKFKNTSSSMRKVRYYNGAEFELPEYYLDHKGHALEKNLKEVFPGLQSFVNEGDLQKALTNTMAKCFPMIPQDSVDIIKNILEAGNGLQN